MEKNQPVLFYYSPVKKGDEIKYVNVIPVLNDKYLGKILPAQYFAAAEKSKRIEVLNMAALKRVSEDILNHPEIIFITDISARILEKKLLEKVLEVLEGKEKYTVLAFNKLRLAEAGQTGAQSLALLKGKGVRIMVYGAEYGSLKSFNTINADIIRLEGRLYNEDSEGAEMLKLMDGYAKGRNMETVVGGVDSAAKLDFMNLCRMELLEGTAVCRPKRNANLLLNTVRQA